MVFELRMLWQGPGNPKTFTELTAPKWLTSEETVKGSTMDQRWFWDQHVLTLAVGQHIDTDFSRIMRIE